MKYNKFKVLLRGLLHGDNIVPSDDETLLGLVEYSLNMISERAESLHLLDWRNTRAYCHDAGRC